MDLPAQQLLFDAIDVLEEIDVPYAVMGGFAVRTWGLPRPTYDADLLVDPGTPGIPPMIAALEEEGFNVPPEHRAGFQDRIAGMAKIKAVRFEGDRTWDVDLFLVGEGLPQSAFERRRIACVGERPMPIVAPEDLILFKLIAYRNRDRADVDDILLVTPDLDRDYLRGWADRLAVRDRLETALRGEDAGT